MNKNSKRLTRLIRSYPVQRSKNSTIRLENNRCILAKEVRKDGQAVKIRTIIGPNEITTRTIRIGDTVAIIRQNKTPLLKGRSIIMTVTEGVRNTSFMTLTALISTRQNLESGSESSRKTLQENTHNSAKTTMTWGVLMTTTNGLLRKPSVRRLKNINSTSKTQ